MAQAIFTPATSVKSDFMQTLAGLVSAYPVPAFSADSMRQNSRLLQQCVVRPHYEAGRTVVMNQIGEVTLKTISPTQKEFMPETLPAVERLFNLVSAGYAIQHTELSVLNCSNPTPSTIISFIAATIDSIGDGIHAYIDTLAKNALFGNVLVRDYQDDCGDVAVSFADDGCQEIDCTAKGLTTEIFTDALATLTQSRRGFVGEPLVIIPQDQFVISMKQAIAAGLATINDYKKALEEKSLFGKAMYHPARPEQFFAPIGGFRYGYLLAQDALTFSYKPQMFMDGGFSTRDWSHAIPGYNRNAPYLQNRVIGIELGQNSFRDLPGWYISVLGMVGMGRTYKGSVIRFKFPAADALPFLNQTIS